MIEKKLPYTEARRLRYCIQTCKLVLERRTRDIDSMIDSLLRYASVMDTKLSDYTRRTGKIRTRAVAKGYVDFCKWMGWLDVYGDEIIVNGNTTFIATLSNNEEFKLDRAEKIGLFLRIIENDVIVNLMTELSGRNRMRDHIRKYSEHIVETTFDWLVDLGILVPASKAWGFFDLTNFGSDVLEALRLGNREEAAAIYSKHFLKKRVVAAKSIPRTTVQRLLAKSTRKIGFYTRSQFDSQMHSAYPLILSIQLLATVEEAKSLSVQQIKDLLTSLSVRGSTAFNWDSFSNRGYIRMPRQGKR